MKLTVPSIKQPPNSADCGIACIAMILEYYGAEYDYKQLRKEIGVKKWGTSAPQLGCWLIEKGFDVEIVTMHPALFTLYTPVMDKKKMLKHLVSFRGKIKQRLNVTVLEHFIDFVKAGGIITPRVPGVADIKQEIAAKRPLICLLTHWFLHKHDLEPRFTFHFNVISGIDSKHITVNDPDWGLEGETHQHKLDDYLYAVHASAYGALDNASFMKISPRRALQK